MPNERHLRSFLSKPIERKFIEQETVTEMDQSALDDIECKITQIYGKKYDNQWLWGRHVIGRVSGSRLCLEIQNNRPLWGRPGRTPVGLCARGRVPDQRSVMYDALIELAVHCVATRPVRWRGSHGIISGPWGTTDVAATLRSPVTKATNDDPRALQLIAL